MYIYNTARPLRDERRGGRGATRSWPPKRTTNRKVHHGLGIFACGPKVLPLFGVIYIYIYIHIYIYIYIYIFLST